MGTQPGNERRLVYTRYTRETSGLLQPLSVRRRRMTEKEQLAPYNLVKPGWEGIYTGEKSDTPEVPMEFFKDDKGNVFSKWSTWPFAECGAEWAEWGDESRHINRIQEALGPLSDEVRRIRIQIGGLVLCDSGVPVSIDELLRTIGSGVLAEEPFKVGCWPGGEGRSTQPCHHESMRIIESVLRGYLAGKPEEHFIREFPHAAGFVRRTYDWLGPSQDLTQLRKLMLERMLLPFEHFCSDMVDYDVIMRVADKCFGDDGAGAEIDKQICELADLPEIQRLRYGMYEKNVETIEDAEKRDLYTVCTRIACGVYELSDCHHNTFRVVENQIYGIAKGRMGGIPGRAAGAERKRLGQLLFGYALALDRWLLGQPMQFLLLDLGHVDLGFDPKNEILRVYAYLGEDRTAVKQWLVASLWCNLNHNPHGGLKPSAVPWSERHSEMLAKAKELGMSARDWMDSQLERTDNKTDARDGS